MAMMTSNEMDFGFLKMLISISFCGGLIGCKYLQPKNYAIFSWVNFRMSALQQSIRQSYLSFNLFNLLARYGEPIK